MSDWQPCSTGRLRSQDGSLFKCCLFLFSIVTQGGRAPSHGALSNDKQSESEFGLFAMYVIQTQNLQWQEGANNKHIRILN